MGSVGIKPESNYSVQYVEGTPSNSANAKTVVNGVQDVLKDFGFSDALKAIYFNNKGTIRKGEAAASMNGLGDLIISNKYLTSTENVRNDVVSDTFYGTGAHEAGHAVINELLKKNVDINSDVTNKTSSRINLERATARSTYKLEKQILKEAKKRFGTNPPISKYGSTKPSEKVAEAVSDVYANKASANPYSKIIVQVMKDIKSGKFRPKISVSKREMGI